MTQKAWTVKQHFVPQIYLKGFSPNGSGIYRFDLKRTIPSSNLIPIRSIAYEKNLYEIRDSEGNIAFRNYIENCLSNMEGMFADHLQTLLKKVSSGQLPSSEKLLTDEDLVFWMVYTILQVIRTPKMLKQAETSFQSHLKNEVSPYYSRAHVIASSFPFFKGSDLKDNTLFNSLLKSLFGMSYFIGIDKGNGIWTSDNPVCCSSRNIIMCGYDLVIFPLCSSLVLIFANPSLYPTETPETLFVLTDKQLMFINDNVVFEAYESVFSQKFFTFEDITSIMWVQGSDEKKNDKR